MKKCIKDETFSLEIHEIDIGKVIFIFTRMNDANKKIDVMKRKNIFEDKMR